MDLQVIEVPQQFSHVPGVHSRAFINSVHANAALSTFATAYEPGEYIADFMCPPVPVEHFSDEFWKRSLYDVITPYDDLQGPSGRPNEINYSSTLDSYNVILRELMTWVPWFETQNADPALNPEEEGTDVVMNAIMLAAEIRVATAMQTASNYAAANQIAATADWADEVNGKPDVDLDRAIAALSVGANSLVRVAMSLELWQEFRRHPRIKSLLGSDERGPSSMQAFEEIWSTQRRRGGPKVELYVPDAQKNTATRDAAGTVTKARIWSTASCVVARVPVGKPTTKTMMFAARYRLLQGGGENDVAVYTWNQPDRGAGPGSTGIKCSRFESDPKIVQSDSGSIITGV